MGVNRPLTCGLVLQSSKKVVNIQARDLKRYTLGTIKLEIHESERAAGEAAAQAAAQELRRLADSASPIAVIFATGASQLEALRALTSIPDLPWKRVHGFHLDEYLGMDKNHPASFRRYLRENLTQLVPSF